MLDNDDLCDCGEVQNDDEHLPACPLIGVVNAKQMDCTKVSMAMSLTSLNRGVVFKVFV